jgi:hypothetical protein
MRVVEAASERTGAKATVVVEGSNVEVVRSFEARNLALEHAKKMGMSIPGFCGSAWTVWVDDSGKELNGDDFKAASTKVCRASYPIQEAAL